MTTTNRVGIFLEQLFKDIARLLRKARDGKG